MSSMALRCLTRTRTEVTRLSSLPKSVKLFSTTTDHYDGYSGLTPKPGSLDPFTKSQFAHIFSNPAKERVYGAWPCTLHFVKDENGCFHEDVIEAAKSFVRHFNIKHNTEFELVKVCEGHQYPHLKIMNMYLKLIDGHVPHVYYVSFKNDQSPDGEGLIIHSWRTLISSEYDLVYNTSNS